MSLYEMLMVVITVIDVILRLRRRRLEDKE